MSRIVISRVIHAALITAVIGWSAWGAYTFWATIFGSGMVAVGALLVIEVTTIAGTVLWWLDDPSPLTRLRHLTPVVSTLPIAHSLHALAAPAVGDVTGWIVAGILTLAIAVVSWLAWDGLGRTIIDLDALIERQRQRQWEQEQQRRQRDIQHVRDILHSASTILQLADEITPPAALPSPASIIRLVPSRPPTGGAQVDEETAETVPCARCNAPIPLAGRSVKAVRAASGRYGCPACTGADA